MTLAQALAQIDELSRLATGSAPVFQKEALCPETVFAVRILAAAYERVRPRDPLYGERRRAGALPPPPGRVLPG
jgi:hypothetical protein